MTIADLEYYWTANHEDLQLDPIATDLGKTTFPQYPNFADEHGTAVFGEMVAKDNGYGVTGGVPDATMRGISPQRARPTGSPQYNTAAALTYVAQFLSPGDVVLIEQQTVGPGGGTKYVPIEWTQANFDAIKVLSDLAIIVMETGGNGGEDLDSAPMLGRFDRTVRDSGAIIGGAGSATTHAALNFSSLRHARRPAGLGRADHHHRQRRQPVRRHRAGEPHPPLHPLLQRHVGRRADRRQRDRRRAVLPEGHGPAALHERADARPAPPHRHAADRHAAGRAAAEPRGRLEGHRGRRPGDDRVVLARRRQRLVPEPDDHADRRRRLGRGRQGRHPRVPPRRRRLEALHRPVQGSHARTPTRSRRARRTSRATPRPGTTTFNVYDLETPVDGSAGGAVPATLSLTLGGAASFGAFAPGVDRVYTATTTANVISSAGDATLTVTDPSTVAPGRLVNGAFALTEPLRGDGQARAPSPRSAAPASRC